MDIQKLLNRIDNTKKEIEKLRPLTQEEAKQLYAYYKIGVTYTSNALEGNSLTLTETKVLIEDGLTVGGKPIRDCFEAIGHAQAYDFMLEAARSKPSVISENTILRLHQLFYNKIEPERAGVYRNERVFISGTEYLPPKPNAVPALMKTFVSELNEKWENTHPLILSAFAHKKLVDIHPFIDGNGRTARLLMNLILISHGYQIISIPPLLRTDYINALKDANYGGKIKFDLFIAECEIEAQKEFCRMFDIKPQK